MSPLSRRSFLLSLATLPWAARAAARSVAAPFTVDPLSYTFVAPDYVIGRPPPPRALVRTLGPVVTREWARITPHVSQNWDSATGVHYLSYNLYDGDTCVAVLFGTSHVVMDEGVVTLEHGSLRSIGGNLAYQRDCGVTDVRVAGTSTTWREVTWT